MSESKNSIPVGELAFRGEFRCYGPPGTGKTTWLARQITEAARSHGSDALFVASFTKTAAAELAGRQLPIERSRIGTIHAHCYRALGGAEIAETRVEEWNEAHPARKLRKQNGSLDDPFGDVYGKGDAKADEVYSAMQNMRAQMRDIRTWPVSARGFYEDWQKWKSDAGYLDFTDLLEIAYNEVQVAPGSPAIGFFDEVQDFTPLELSLVRRWGESMDYFILAGDDDQCIYSFKGATPDAFLNPKVAPENKRILAQSYRVPRAVHSFASRWIERVKHREPKVYQPTSLEGEVKRVHGTWSKPESLVRQAIDYAEEDKSVMFLSSCSYQLQPIIKFLKMYAMPYHNPYRTRRGDWNPLHMGKRITPTERILSLLRPDSSTWGDSFRVWHGCDLKRWVGVLDSKCDLLTHGLKEEIKKLDDGEVDSDLFSRFNAEPLERILYDVHGSLDLFYSMVLRSKQKPLKYPLRVAKQRGGRALRNTPKITVGTIHSVKGGEADVVYVFPDLSKAGFIEWEGGRVRRESVIRQFYVAFTRARETLVLCEPATALRVDFN